MIEKAKTFLTGFGVLAGLFLIGSLMESRDSKARGAYSSPVSVMNTTSNPAITSDADRSTRIPYQSRSSFSLLTFGPGPQRIQLFGFAVVPTGYRLILTNVSIDVFAGSGNPVPAAEIATVFSLNTPFPAVTGVYTGSSPAAGGHAIINQEIIRYVGGGDSPEVNLYADFATIPTGHWDTLVLTGYLEDCAVTGCPAIVF